MPATGITITPPLRACVAKGLPDTLRALPLYWLHSTLGMEFSGELLGTENLCYCSPHVMMTQKGILPNENYTDFDLVLCSWQVGNPESLGVSPSHSS